jgi:hypothetical protein
VIRQRACLDADDSARDIWGNRDVVRQTIPQLKWRRAPIGETGRIHAARFRIAKGGTEAHASVLVAAAAASSVCNRFALEDSLIHCSPGGHQQHVDVRLKFQNAGAIVFEVFSRHSQSAGYIPKSKPSLAPSAKRRQPIRYVVPTTTPKERTGVRGRCSHFECNRHVIQSEPMRSFAAMQF